MDISKLIQDIFGTADIPRIVVVLNAVTVVLVAIVKFFALQEHLRRWILGKLSKRKHLVTTSSFTDPVLHSIKQDADRRLRFKELTGINLHPDRIDALTTLRNKSNGAFDWPHLKTAMPFIRFNGQEYEVSISRKARMHDITVRTLFLVPALLFLILFILMIVSIIVETDARLFPQFLGLLFSLVGTFMTLFFIQYIRSPYLCARFIEKNLI